MSFFPASHSLNVYSGDTVSFDLTYQEGPAGSEAGVSLAGATVAASIAPAPGQAATTSFVVTPDADQGANPGKMTVVLPAANSELLTGSTYSYDVEVTWSDASVQTILRGDLTVTQDVTA